MKIIQTSFVLNKPCEVNFFFILSSFYPCSEILVQSHSKDRREGSMDAALVSLFLTLNMYLFSQINFFEASTSCSRSTMETQEQCVKSFQS